MTRHSVPLRRALISILFATIVGLAVAHHADMAAAGPLSVGIVSALLVSTGRIRQAVRARRGPHWL